MPVYRSPCACCESDCCVCGTCEFHPDATVDFESKTWACGSTGPEGLCDGGSNGDRTQITGATLDPDSCGRFIGGHAREWVGCASASCVEPTWDSGCLVIEDNQGMIGYDCANGYWADGSGNPIEDPDGNRITACTGGTLSWSTECNGSVKHFGSITITVNNNETCEGAPPP